MRPTIDSGTIVRRRHARRHGKTHTDLEIRWDVQDPPDAAHGCWDSGWEDMERASSALTAMVVSALAIPCVLLVWVAVEFVGWWLRGVG